MALHDRTLHEKAGKHYVAFRMVNSTQVLLLQHWMSAGCPNSKHFFFSQCLFHLRETITTSLHGCNIHSNTVMALLTTLSRKAEAGLSFVVWEQMHTIMDLLAQVTERLKKSIFRLYPQRRWSLPKASSRASWMANLTLVDAQSTLITVQKLPNKRAPVQQSACWQSVLSVWFAKQNAGESSISQFEFLPGSQ